MTGLEVEPVRPQKSKKAHTAKEGKQHKEPVLQTPNQFQNCPPAVPLQNKRIQLAATVPLGTYAAGERDSQRGLRLRAFSANHQELRRQEQRQLQVAISDEAETENYTR